MKQWITAEVEEISLNETANGGMPSMDFDQQWFDQKGELHVNFVQQEPTPPQS